MTHLNLTKIEFQQPTENKHRAVLWGLVNEQPTVIDIIESNPYNMTEIDLAIHLLNVMYDILTSECVWLTEKAFATEAEKHGIDVQFTSLKGE